MKNCIGIRREDKDSIERRAPLTPGQVRKLITEHQIRVIVEPSPSRIFTEEEYRQAGAEINEDLRACNLIFGIKEIPLPSLQPNLTYCFFSHTIKAQPYNMPMLKKMMELADTLLDYELVKNKEGRRTIYFGNYAGYAGMIDSLWALGQRLLWEGIDNPFKVIQPAHRYQSLKEAEAAVRAVGKEIRKHGLPEPLVPFITGFTGYGQVSRGAQAIYDQLNGIQLQPDELPTFIRSGKFSSGTVYKVEFRKPDMFEPIEQEVSVREFTWYEFNRYPERYRGKLEKYIPFLTMLVNGIYWEPRFPRLLSNEFLKQLFQEEPQPRLRVIGDITCDIQGSIEATVKATNSKNPVYVFDPLTGEVSDGWAGRGPVIMAVDKLPTELPREASEFFGSKLMPYIPALAAADFRTPLEELNLPPEFRKAVILLRGELTPPFEYLRNAVEAVGKGDT